MECTFSVTGANRAELQTAAETVAAEFADGDDFTITINGVYGEMAFDESKGRFPGANEQAPTFTASVTAKVADPPKAGSS